MRINVKTSTGRDGGQFLDGLAERIESNLPRFRNRITNLDVLLIDDVESRSDAAKGCFMEARLTNLELIAVKARANSFERAVTVGAQKIEEIAGRKLAEESPGASSRYATLDWIPEGTAEE